MQGLALGEKKWKFVAFVVLALAALWYFRGDGDADAESPGIMGTVSSGFAAAKSLVGGGPSDPPSAETDRLIAAISATQKRAIGVPACPE
jgi:hypothetical protein